MKGHGPDHRLGGRGELYCSCVGSDIPYKGKLFTIPISAASHWSKFQTTDDNACRGPINTVLLPSCQQSGFWFWVWVVEKFLLHICTQWNCICSLFVQSAAVPQYLKTSVRTGRWVGALSPHGCEVSCDVTCWVIIGNFQFDVCSACNWLFSACLFQLISGHLTRDHFIEVCITAVESTRIKFRCNHRHSECG